MRTYWQWPKKYFVWEDMMVVIDFQEHKKKVRYFCGICKQYAAVKHYGYSKCLHCSGEE